MGQKRYSVKKNNLLLFALSVFFLLGNHLAQAQTGVSLSAKVYLQGALIGVPDGENLMRDDLRAAGLLPISEPYKHTGPGGTAATVKPAIFMNIGPDAIVDWLSLELRSADNPAEVLAYRSALLQRDGDVVGLNGHSAVHFEGVEAGNYYLAVRHRNHLGIMIAEAVWLSETPIFIDFSKPDEPAYGDYAQVPLGDVMAMWAGDLNNDGKSIFQGPGNDNFFLFSQVLSDAGNTDFNANFITSGYFATDLDLDGRAIYSGPGSDRDKFFSHVMGSAYSLSGGGAWLNMVLRENLP